MDSLQLLLIIVIVSLASLLIVVGVYVLILMRQIQKVVKKIEKALDIPAEKVGENVMNFIRSLRHRA